MSWRQREANHQCTQFPLKRPEGLILSDEVRLSLSETHNLATLALISHGLSREHAHAIAVTVTAAERDGCKAHGLFRIPAYVAGVRTGRVNGDAVPEIEELGPVVLRVDAQRGYAPLPLEIGSAALAEIAKKYGMGALALVRCYHIAALWPEVERLAEQGLVVFAFTTYRACVAPAGGHQPVYGTNPMAFGWPREAKPPLVFDQASSVRARGEIMLHARDKEPIPLGWAVDAEGNPTTDPTKALAGAQLTFGGYKGAAIALMIELLAGPLIGELLSFEASEADPDPEMPTIGGELMLAIDPVQFIRHGSRKAQLAQSERLFSKILEDKEARLPSERRHKAREHAIADGIRIPRALHDVLLNLAATGNH